VKRAPRRMPCVKRPAISEFIICAHSDPFGGQARSHPQKQFPFLQGML
jgi:hypothetical protein